ncbi:anti-anti-sigma factor [Cyclonatronum proteinivorum]|uniref:Anti-sigma factor antagonist n=1 Tax=Cyclonatronum proteinivorum TaxID=1457365 RepID=A0A345UNZ8_9BACT|nr:STAS domain-containing protein [Cyclonatronum proteinivorum]AXJ02200.1 anti-anti-sigma factor [Cyclonatronum proteinivorum]
MKLDLQQNEDYALLTPHASKLDSTVAPDLKSNIILLGNTFDTGGLIINLENVEFADSSGLSALLLAFRMYRDSGRTLVLCCLQERVQKLLDISQLTNSFIIKERLDEAIEVFTAYESDDDEDADDDDDF